MKPIKMFGLAALAALMVMAFVGASSATAEEIRLCSADQSEGVIGSDCEVTHVHETTLTGAKAKLLTSIITVECDVLFLGDTVEETSEPLLIEGNLTYSNCGGCAVEETGGGFSVEVLRLGHETADVTYEGEIHVNCSGLNCYYSGEGLLGTDKGPLLSSETNGEVVISEQTIKKVKGLFCPSTSKLDITTTPLAAIYLGEQLVHYCVLYPKTHGFYLTVSNGVCGTLDNTRRGNFELVEGRGFVAGDMVCVLLGEPEPNKGLFKTRVGRVCTEDNAADTWNFELGTIQ